MIESHERIEATGVSRIAFIIFAGRPQLPIPARGATHAGSKAIKHGA